MSEKEVGRTGLTVPAGGATARRAMPWLAGLLLAGAAAYFALTMWQRWPVQNGWDFANDWLAVKGMRTGLSLYDADGLHRFAQPFVEVPARDAHFVGVFGGFDNLPPTALIIWPFTFWPFPVALNLYRLLLMIIFAGAIALTGQALRPADRRAGWFWGAMGALLLQPIALSISLGQVDAWIMLGLAVAVVAVSRRAWLGAGAGAGLAGVLKLSPLLLVGYLVLQRRWQAAVGAGLVVFGALGMAALIGPPGDLWLWVSRVMPTLSAGSLSMGNQSLPGWLARLFLPETNFLYMTIDLGPWRWLSPLLALVALAVIWSVSRREPLHPLAIALVILSTVLIGPIAWPQYAAWALIPLVLMADRRLWATWRRRHQIELLGLLVLGGVLMNLPVKLFDPASIAAQPLLRLATGTVTLGLLLWFGVGLALLARAQESPNAQPMAAEEPGTALYIKP
ncbi:MAG: DUF2029 domain-containing protein [Candidatus Dormibacteraeota bacterium]|nr:DUF2029 domain-containing protein [Candidatus Dormibacteraeota bacterium]